MSDGIAGDMPSGVPDHRNARQTLAQRRSGGSIDFVYGSINATFTVSFSLYADWRCAEIFVAVDRTQGDLEANVRDAGILASYALQHGATIETLCAGVTHEPDGRGSSIVGTALHLVKHEIDRLRGAAPAPGDEPGAPPPDAGQGGAAEAVAVGLKDDQQSLNRKTVSGTRDGRASGATTVT